MENPQESFISHLIELRDRLIRALLFILVIFLGLVNWARDIYTLLAAPMLAALPEGGQMIATDVVGAFFVPMKVTLMVSFLIALPYVLYQTWSFVAPGLYAHEKKLALPLLAASVLLFFIGMGFAYFVVFPAVFGFINAFAPEGVAVMTDIEKYLSFVLTTFLAFGLTFEVPVVVIVLVRIGLVTVEQLKEARPYVIVGAFVIAAVVTPPDVLSQFLLAVPMWLLYELGIVLAQMIGKSERADEGSYRAASQPMSEVEMEHELDRAEAESSANRERI
ncbi:MAG: twin-arginine translocase subunit TatC [Hydrogenophaga sp.]|uniref:twin-arginine translocase subunit TatC n=1 Tax=Hydrogenophaga sp. TaxID=1904254 RepID=UPI00274F077C|nr:twin-arginine translocase subunit TatC [Hydrogenophaga sp.]MDP1526663.1 twin-arginine translocase subunit TatC [Rhodocyclaceae bacterium]MDZ4190179.1 twin-arginine translocase subunit TatC [Hydrogenophaga sp.]